jgi:hypothetical protein
MYMLSRVLSEYAPAKACLNAKQTSRVEPRDGHELPSGPIRGGLSQLADASPQKNLVPLTKFMVQCTKHGHEHSISDPH